MIRRFQIEDLVAQDESGVVFRALDTQTGKPAAVRRFFPFGVDGGGLNADEQTAYGIAIGRLAGLRHPALRSVIAGGCDPVDGMPFIATEWIEGESLHPLLARGPLAAEVATPLIIQALEVCELLSHVLAEEAVWVETDPQTIILGGQSSGRPFTFWISPLTWLGGIEKGRGLEAIVIFTEEIMGWRGRMVSDQAGRGLGGWLKWLRKSAGTTTLLEARESLAAAIGADPPAPAKRLASRAAQPVKPVKKPKSFLYVNLVLILMIAGLGGWLMMNKRANTTARTDPAAMPASEASAGNKVASETKILSPADYELLVGNDRNPVVIEGVIAKVDRPTGGKTVYLLFDQNPARDAARAGMRIGDRPAEPIIGQFQPFIGRKVRISGTVDLQTGFGLRRPDILIKEVSDVRLVE